MTTIELSQLKSVKQFCRDNPSFTEGGLRHIIFHRDANGFNGCIYKLGSRVLIHEGKFYDILEAQNGGANA